MQIFIFFCYQLKLYAHEINDPYFEISQFYYVLSELKLQRLVHHKLTLIFSFSIIHSFL